MTPTIGKTRVTSGYGWRKLRGVPDRHAGMDLKCENRELRSIWDAVNCEILIGWNSGRGNLVRLYHSAKLRVIYQHLEEIYVKNGSVVKQGQPVGTMGWSGDCVPSGPQGMHLHIEVQALKNGTWMDVDPSGYIGYPNIAGGVFSSSDELDTPNPPPENAMSDFSIIKTGDMVNFTGKTQFATSGGEKPAAAKPGPAKVTKICQKAKYPYHLIAAQNSSSNVYGWVAQNCISKNGNTSSPNKESREYKVGDRLVFSSGYLSSSAGPEEALHTSKNQLAFNKGIVGQVLSGAANPLKMLSPADSKTPICWCNSGDIRGTW